MVKKVSVVSANSIVNRSVVPGQVKVVGHVRRQTNVVGAETTIRRKVVK